MKVLFIFCEGPHDAQFIGRLLKESNTYRDYGEALQKYPTPLDKFISKKFASRDIDEIRIGKPDYPLVPVCALKHKEEDRIVLPISIGGMDNTETALNLLEEIENSFASDILIRPEYDVNALSVMMVYDADSRGVSSTIELFKMRFIRHFASVDTLNASQWTNLKEYPFSLFIFTGADKNTGTLEDNLLALFSNKNQELVTEIDSLIQKHFEPCPIGADTIAYNAKRKKGILNACGQTEKRNAGSALTVVVRDTKLLKDAFNFNDEGSQWSQLLKLIDDAFNLHP